MKRNIDDFNGVGDFIISIVTVVAWVLIVAIITIGYFTIETKGEGIILSYISTIFTVISSLGIVATLVVYFRQKKDQEIRDKRNIDNKKESIKHLIKIIASNFDYVINNLEAELNLGYTEKAIERLEKIDTKLIERCLIDSKDIDISLFYNISYLLDAVIEQREIIKDKILKDPKDTSDYEHVIKIHCYSAKKEIDMLYQIIMDC
ncbi:TPA: hypothetical protein KEW43_000828 [Proteus mirabilis]|nr:hypothetical protein [Proteus mirabilis]